MPETPPQFWTEAFIEHYVEALNEDEAFQDTARGFSDTIILRCLDGPEGQDVEAAYTFRDGEVVDVELWMENAPSDELREAPFDKKSALARATATYDTWIKLDTGELTAMGALASPDYTIEGPKFKIMSHMGVFTGMSAVSAKVEKRY